MYVYMFNISYVMCLSVNAGEWENTSKSLRKARLCLTPNMFYGLPSINMLSAKRRSDSKLRHIMFVWISFNSLFAFVRSDEDTPRNRKLGRDSKSNFMAYRSAVWVVGVGVGQSISAGLKPLCAIIRRPAFSFYPCCFFLNKFYSPAAAQHIPQPIFDNVIVKPQDEDEEAP